MSFLGKKTPNPNLEIVEELVPNFLKRFELMEEVMYGGSGQNIITRLDKLEKKIKKYMEEGSSVDKSESVLNTENAVNEEELEEEEKRDVINDITVSNEA
jgi:uncharacterized membrane protein YukC